MMKESIKSWSQKYHFFHSPSFKNTFASSNKKNHHFDLYIILDWINSINAYRRISLFARLSWIKFWSVASQLHWLDADHRLFGLTINDDILNLPTDFYAIFGVLIYIIRLTINLYISLNYIFFSQDDLSITARFYSECERAHWYIIGDIVSSTINLLTNFSTYFRLAAPIASYLVIALLAFTFLKLVYFYMIEKQKYNKHEQYLRELNPTIDTKHHRTVTLLQKQLDHQRTEMQWRLYLSIIASLFLLTSFVISVTCAPQITLPLFLYMSVIGGVMYLSAENFGQFMCARKEYQHGRSAEKRLVMIEKRNLFLSTMIKNLIVPMLLVGLFAIHWPTALALSLLYVVFTCYFAEKKPKLSPEGIPYNIRLEVSPQKTYASFFRDELNESIVSNTVQGMLSESKCCA